MGAAGVMGMGPVGGMFFGHYPIPPPPPFGPTFPIQNGGIPMMGYGYKYYYYKQYIIVIVFIIN
jgi:hypothetical protein